MTRSHNRRPIDRAYLHLIRADLAPIGALEGLLADRVALLAWRLKVASDRERYAKPDRAVSRSRSARLVDREFRRAHDQFRSIRAERRQVAKSEDLPARDLSTSSHLKKEALIGDGTPLIKGTLISAGRVIGHIVEGWSWSEILAIYPELSESDIRECLAYSIESDPENLFG